MVTGFHIKRTDLHVALKLIKEAEVCDEAERLFGTRICSDWKAGNTQRKSV